MVDEKTIKETLTILKVTYPSALKDLDKNTAILMINVWLKDFKNTKKELFLEAINNIRNKSEFFPNVAQIKKEIANLEVKDIPKAEDEWQEVIRAVHKFGENISKVREYLKPYTFYIANNIGYINICNSDEERQIWNRKEFIGEYNALKDKEIENIQIGVEERTFLTNNTILLEEK